MQIGLLSRSQFPVLQHGNLTVRTLSGEALDAHIHAPATEDQNGPVLLTRCSSPAPPIGDNCITDSSGTLQISANITPSVLQQSGLTGVQFLSYLNDGLLYVNVHTSLNPAGEVRGQIHLRKPIDKQSGAI